jgi:acyl-CoA synthetase (AMP-forming)/AMP-acid ligase II
MYPRVHAQRDPHKPAIVMAGSGEIVTYGELDARSSRVAQLLHRRGLRPRDGVALCVENSTRFHEIVWGANRSGLYFTPISTRLGVDEAAYIVNDCGAKAIIVSAAHRALAESLTDRIPGVTTRLLIDDTDLAGWESFDEALSTVPAEPLEVELQGVDMLYSSGTTGRPKGVRRPFTGLPADAPDPLVSIAREAQHFTEDSVYLSPAPLYHGAPLHYSLLGHRIGATVVVMERFDARHALQLVEEHRVTHSQWVPTMFVRMLKLPDADRHRYDLSSHQVAIHSAAPCPIEVKERMIDWWGPILFEYYTASEGVGYCSITSEEWLSHRGSVGRPIRGELHIVDDDGNECEVGVPGAIYFSGFNDFEYHNDPAKTAEARNERGWYTMGDVGYVDADGYLYLTDRRAFTIISGGVNIYPQEAENVLTMHPKVFDVAVFGVPNDEFGEEVKAVVQPVDPRDAGPELEAELLAYCRERLASYKCPRSVDFEAELPRHPTGKLYKRLLRDRYWGDRAGSIV